jgi:Zn-finger nucleic acid-binding protein
MREVEYEGVMVRTCEGCGGEFIGADELAHVIRTREERFGSAMRDDVSPHHRPRFGVPDAEMRRTLQCPACHGAMAVCNYCGDTGIYVDRCDRCGGMWLDCEELETIQILTERWADSAPEQMRAIASELEEARRRAANAGNNAFAGSRFAFVNAIINRVLDAA